MPVPPRSKCAMRRYRQAWPRRVGSRPKKGSGETPLSEKVYLETRLLCRRPDAAARGGSRGDRHRATSSAASPEWAPASCRSCSASCSPFIGILIAGTALGSSEPDDKKFLPDNPQWFGWFCILARPRPVHHPRRIWRHDSGGVRLRLRLRARRQDRRPTNRRSFWRAGVTVFGVLLFHYFLNIPFPLLRGVNL